MMKADRFKLEEQILNTSNFSDQIRLISKNVSDYQLDNDQIVNVLEGLAILIELHTNDLFTTFKQAFNLDEYKS
jgi:hypothetical protein